MSSWDSKPKLRSRVSLSPRPLQSAASLQHQNAALCLSPRVLLLPPCPPFGAALCVPLNTDVPRVWPCLLIARVLSSSPWLQLLLTESKSVSLAVSWLVSPTGLLSPPEVPQVHCTALRSPTQYYSHQVSSCLSCVLSLSPQS